MLARWRKSTRKSWHPERSLQKHSGTPWGTILQDMRLLPLAGRVLRVLIFGGGGCGKTKIINDVLTPLFRRFYGARGCVLTAFSNKAARLIKGKTGHTLVKIRGAQSLTMARLKTKSKQEKRAFAAMWAPVGALVKDEFSQQAATLEHAIAVRAMYGRERSHDLRCEDYARSETNYASIPIVVTCGDPLQFPLCPLPAPYWRIHRINQKSIEVRSKCFNNKTMSANSRPPCDIEATRSCRGFY